MLSIKKPVINRNAVSWKLDIPRSLKHFFKTGELAAEYDESIESCPEPVLNIPAVMVLAPLAWACNVDLDTPALDAVFHSSLESVKAGYSGLFPAVFENSGGSVMSSEVVEVACPDSRGGRPAVFFSGGVDSIAAVISVIEKKPALITVWGPDIDLDNFKAWERVLRESRRFAGLYGLESHYVRSNFRQVFRHSFIDHTFEKDLGRSWWGAVQHGVAFPALAAPLAYKHAYTEVLLASEGVLDAEYPGGKPLFADELKWTGTGASISDSEVIRQDKLARILEHLSGAGAALQIRSCLESGGGVNCSGCLKCYRTILGLILEDGDPNTLGFSVDKRSLPEIRSNLESGSSSLSFLDVLYWKDLQRRIDKKKRYLYDEHGFFEWLADADIQGFYSGYSPRPKITEAFIRLPYPISIFLYDTAKAVKNFIVKKVARR